MLIFFANCIQNTFLKTGLFEILIPDFGKIAFQSTRHKILPPVEEKVKNLFGVLFLSIFRDIS
jgi:hypothetical protein